MNLQEIAQEMLKDIEKYATYKEVEVPKVVQARTHKKWKVNKKWKKRFGMKVVYEKKMARVADITIENVLDFCSEKGLPVPAEIMSTMQNN